MEYAGKKLRHELKYYINQPTYHILRERIRIVAEADENMRDPEGYMVKSLYFDDMYNSALSDKVNGTRFRKKYRIRTYDNDNSLIRLECKYKLDSLTAKDGTLLTLEEYESIFGGDYDFLLYRPEKLCRDLFVQNRIRLLKPTTIVQYQREAYVVPEGNVRITFDKDIEASVNDLDLLDRDAILSATLPNGITVLEVKYDDYMPPYIQRLINGEQLMKSAISKYVMCKNRNARVRQYD